MYLRTLGVLTAAFLSILFVVMAHFMPSATMLTASADNQDLKCLAQAVYFEARGEPFSGQIAVAQVVHNRVEARKKSYCNVVFEGSQRRNACQFSFACDGKSDKPINKIAWKRALNIAKLVKSGYLRDLSGDATFYHAISVHPNWSRTMEQTASIGHHIFYRKM